MKLSSNGYYVEKYLKCGNCGTLLFEGRSAGRQPVRKPEGTALLAHEMASVSAILKRPVSIFSDEFARARKRIAISTAPWHQDLYGISGHKLDV